MEHPEDDEVHVDDEGRRYILVEVEINGERVQMKRYLDPGGSPNEQRLRVRK